jgi:hypothetical protein
VAAKDPAMLGEKSSSWLPENLRIIIEMLPQSVLCSSRIKYYSHGLKSLSILQYTLV